MSAINKYFLLIFLFFLCHPIGFSQTNKRIATFGSSVCNGTGDETTLGGYSGRLSSLMKKYGFEVISVSRGGDNTIFIQDRWKKSSKPVLRVVKENQYLEPVNPKYVFIGLSLANEGLMGRTRSGQDSIFEQYKEGLESIIKQCRKSGYAPIVANCYPNESYNSEEYELIKKMNLIIGSWQLPSVDFLGSIDDGAGHWVEGFYRDGWHPSSGGHREMFFSIPPTLFSALEINKPVPEFLNDNNSFTILRSDRPSFIYEPSDTIHSFTVSISVKDPNDITLIKTIGNKGIIDTSEYSEDYKKKISLNVFAINEFFENSLSIKNGELFYSSQADKNSEIRYFIKKNEWYRITMTHQPAKGETKIYIQDSLLAVVPERIIPNNISIGLNGTCEIKDILIYRSALNQGEIAQNISGKLFHSSLEIYSPLNDQKVTGDIINYAQSLSRLRH